MISCLEVRRLQSAFLDLSLEPDTEQALRRHLAGCTECEAALAARSPVTAMALVLDRVAVGDDAGFVGEVLAGLHQRKLERRLTHRWRGWMAAAAAVALAVFGGWSLLRQPSSLPANVAAARPRPVASAAEPAFVEVKGDGVRLYQLDSPAQGAVRVAFVVDPHLEL
jgi:predicted anti-sigma-YlaC factor YlaD